MKGIKSKVPVTIADRKGTRQGIVFITITEDTRIFASQKRKLKIVDFEVIENPSPMMGENMYHYQMISATPKVKYFSDTDLIWSNLNKDIVKTESLESQLDDFYVDILLAEAQEEPLRDSTASDWEYFNTEEAIQPE
jgi:hypothetical protein